MGRVNSFGLVPESLGLLGSKLALIIGLVVGIAGRIVEVGWGELTGSTIAIESWTRKPFLACLHENKNNKSCRLDNTYATKYFQSFKVMSISVILMEKIWIQS